jgi:hypothetical protein
MATPFAEPKTDAEAQRLKAFLEKGARVSLETLETFELTEPVIARLREPGTLKFDVTGERLQGLAGDDPSKRVTVTLDVGAVLNPQDFFVRVFIGNPEASEDIDPEDPSSRGGFSFFCEVEAQEPGMLCPIKGNPLRIVSEVSSALRELREPGESLIVSLVLVPLIDTQEAAVQVDRAEISVLQSTVELAE